MRKPDFCLCENKGADQLCSNCEADQRLCFRYTDSTTSVLFLNPKFQASSLILKLYRPVCVRPVRKPHCWFLARLYESTGRAIAVTPASAVVSALLKC